MLTYSLNKWHHQPEKSTIAVNIEAITKATVFQSFDDQVEIIDSSLYSCSCKILEPITTRLWNRFTNPNNYQMTHGRQNVTLFLGMKMK